MPVLDDKYNYRLNDYITTRFEPYINWYIDNTKISKNNLFAALVVIVICTLCLLFIQNPIEQMSLFQYSFDPTFIIKLGLLISIVLAFFSIFTSYKKMKNCLIKKALLQSEHTRFSARETERSGLYDEVAFAEFVYAVDGIMAAANPEVVISVSQDILINAKTLEVAEN